MTEVVQLLRDFLRIKGLHLAGNSIFRTGNPTGGNLLRHSMKSDLDHHFTEDLHLTKIWIGLTVTLGQGKDCWDLVLPVQDLKDCQTITHLLAHQGVLECHHLFDTE